MKRVMVMVVVMLAVLGVLVPVASSWAQDAKAAPPAAAAGTGNLVTETGEAAVATQSQGGSLGLWTVIWSSGWLGAFIWIGLFGTAGIGVYLSVDSAILIRPDRIMSPALISTVTEAMAEGDVMKALECCED
mgnify:FL=1